MLAEAEIYGRALQEICHERAKDSGWWTNLQTDALFTGTEVRAMVPEKLLLIHSEVSEATEAFRKSLMDSHLPERDGLEVELADAVIRIMDLAGAMKLDIGAAISAKLAYNAQRADHKLSARREANGKRF